MSHFEDEEELQVEFSDLPPDEIVKRSISGQLVDSGSRLFSQIEQYSERVKIQRSRLATVVQRWLHGNATANKIPTNTNVCDEVVDVTFIDLPTDEEPRHSVSISKPERHQTPRVRVWRLAATACTVGMVLFLLFSSFPSPRNWLYALVVPPTPTPATLGSSTISADESIQKGPNIIGWQAAPIGTAIFGPITPGPIPDYMVCPAPLVQNTSSTIDHTPVYLSGFSGPIARVYLSSSIPVPSFPNLYGFPVPLQVEVPANYTGTVILEGKEVSNNMDVMFGFSPFDDQVTSLALNPLTQDSNHYLLTINGTTRIAWNITMFLPAADCYSLTTSWPHGSSVMNFLAGR